MLIHSIDIEGFGRGAIAVTDLKVGDIALEIPVSAVISEDAMKKSDMVYFCVSRHFFTFIALLGFACVGSNELALRRIRYALGIFINGDYNQWHIFMILLVFVRWLLLLVQVVI